MKTCSVDNQYFQLFFQILATDQKVMVTLAIYILFIFCHKLCIAAFCDFRKTYTLVPASEQLKEANFFLPKNHTKTKTNPGYSHRLLLAHFVLNFWNDNGDVYL